MSDVRFRSLLLYLLPVVLSLAVIPSFLTGCAAHDGWHQAEGMVWNTVWHLTYRGPADLEDSVAQVFSEVELSLSVFNPRSLVSQLNGVDSLEVDQHFVKVYDVSHHINVVSGGMYDPTLSPLITAWGFGKGHKVMPADTLRLDSILEFVGFDKTYRDGMVVHKEDPRIQFNFSSVAKGYGCDAVAAMLARNGVENYMIEIGGEIKVGGCSPRGGKWNVSVDRPVLSDSVVIHESQSVISVSGVGIATSGNYRNFRKEGGQILAHTISPRTGRPVQTDVVSATVVAPTAMEADAVATACMAVGSEKAIAMQGELNFPMMLVLADSSVWASPNFAPLLLKK